MKLLVLNGPNMNMLGIREPEIYGHTTHDDLVAMIVRHAKKEGISVEVKQSNSEGNSWIGSKKPMARSMVSSLTRLPTPIPASEF